MTETVSYGIIGCGMMGQEHIRNIQLLPGGRVEAIVEPDPGMRAECEALVPGVRFCESIAELLSIEALDCLLIASPNYMHVEQLEEIAATRALPILVEKPLYTANEDAARVAAFMASYPAPVWVAMEYRYMPPVAKLLEDAEAVTGGIRMLTIREHRFPFLHKVGAWNRFNAKSGGTLVEKCCHFFDLMRLALQSEPVRVMASAGQDVNHKDESYEGAAPDIWDNGYVIVDFANGARAMLELCMFAEGSRYQEEITAVGPAGKIECLVPGPGRFWPKDLGEPPVPQVIVSPRHPKGPRVLDIPVDPTILDAGDHNGSTYYQHQKFHAVVRGQAAPEVTLQDGAMAVAMGLAAQESARTGQAVQLSAVTAGLAQAC
ncbi:Putative oxidoreductase YteT precursor [Pseudoruegeria aquimaris]|uniref:Putative oxidoreductase YteT n=1 Tax=Pseudoruegeria aquimaris TaxID=393663 RepID=A0A1Y5S687_9RHOB|nr:Gfo/Idh/MocA family oxidoreductase [Pseudoruegeria aquimaris]SLN33449.1 Putative oxidoreductase YteT precursor [Pseudoruegeria aquimaris]